MPTTRYNAGIQRAKGLLELAAALYDGSLSYQTKRAAEGVLQTDTRVGRVVRLSLGARANDIPISFATGSFREIIAVANGKYSMAWVNPSVLLTMACRGKGPFRRPLPLRTIAVFPSWDVMGFAVHESTGITSLAQIAREKIPLSLSTGRIAQNELASSATMFTVSAVLKAAGFTFADVVSARIYVTDADAFQAMNTVYRTYFPTDPPARATVKALLTSADYSVEVTMVAVKGAKTAFTTPTEDGKPGTKNPNLSSAIQVGNRLYVAGTLGNTPTNKGDVKAQTAEVLARVGRTMKLAGFDFTHIVDGVVYLPDLTKFADMNASYTASLVKDRPARATVGAGLMGADGAVEIMFTAVK